MLDLQSVNLLIATLVNEFNYKNVIVFLTKVFEYKAALNKSHLFIHFPLVIIFIGLCPD